MELEDGLTLWASGSPGTEAAVELLIETDYWLRRREFIERALELTHETAAIDWGVSSDLADELVCSRGERFILRLACSLADPDRTVAMSDISALDGHNLGAVLGALETAKFGWPEE